MKSDIIKIETSQLFNWQMSFEKKPLNFDLSDKDRIEDAGLIFLYVDDTEYYYRVIDKHKFFLAKLEYGL